MKKAVREILDFATGAAQSVGVSVHLERGSKHPLLVFEAHGARRVRPIPSNKGDDGVRWAQRDVRKLLREMAG